MLVVEIVHKADYTLKAAELSILYEIFWRIFADLCNLTNKKGGIFVPP
jgi:hypothetical protein